ncbi:cysteine-rich protein 3 isoform X3 [Neofelis nebulosa]|uniref:cysteine-rich protein 3 isoform X3 n=1 Tax=Neofelis nebulosa TaxID=61452 RepID=UPI00272BEC54|nr:cysteine-rich protein 3 isoform X3 [Neofelis nebulosa]
MRLKAEPWEGPAKGAGTEPPYVVPTVCGASFLRGAMSWTCPRCQQPVFFAEKVSSLGKNWHRFCLKCERCHSVLSPGGHAEHNGRPYCHKPCYGALFGPRGHPHMKTFTGETSLCPGCKEPVYFAEKVMSLGRNWHRPCLRCQRCRKTLTAGSHAEVNRHDGVPYCHIPCYGYLFGPKGVNIGDVGCYIYDPVEIKSK